MQEENKTEKGILKFKRDFRDILTNCYVWTQDLLFESYKPFKKCDKQKCEH